MREVFGLVILLAAAASGSSQAIRLEPGEFRWWPIHVRQTPMEIQCRFEVLKGGATVRAELVPQDEFRAFVRRRNYENMASTGTTSNGAFNRIIGDRGDYAVVIMNEADAPTAIVSLNIETNANPTGPGVAWMLPARRRLVVILISFAIFFVSVGWSGHRLIQAMRKAEP